jgi:hypothetical protein
VGVGAEDRRLAGHHPQMDPVLAGVARMIERGISSRPR